MLSRLWGTALKAWGDLPIPFALRCLAMWMVNPKFLVGTAAFILNEQGQVLLFRHTYRGDIPWGLPGGWLKRGEDPARAVEREIMEETGLRACAFQPLWVDTDRVAFEVDLIFSAKLEGGVFRPSAEVSEARFFALDDLPTLPPGQRDLILKLNGLIKP